MTSREGQQPADVDELLADSLRAQSDQDFTWKEPDRRPRWYERAEMQQHAQSSPGEQAAQTIPAHSPADYRTGAGGRGAGGRGADGSGARGPRYVALSLGLVCLLLALWVLASVILGITVNPLLAGLLVCAVGGGALVVAGVMTGRR